MQTQQFNPCNRIDRKKSLDRYFSCFACFVTFYEIWILITGSAASKRYAQLLLRSLRSEYLLLISKNPFRRWISSRKCDIPLTFLLADFDPVFFFFFHSTAHSSLAKFTSFESLSYNKIVHSFCFLCYSTNNLRLIRIIIFIFSRLVLIHDETRRTFFFFLFFFRINSHHTFPSKSWHVPRSLKNWTWENERMPKKKRKMYRIENYTQACKVAYGKIRSAKRSSKNGRGH